MLAHRTSRIDGSASRKGQPSSVGISPNRLRHGVLVGAFVLLILISATQIKSFPPSAVEYGAQFGDGNALRQSLYTLCFLSVVATSRPLLLGWRIVSLPPAVLLLLLFCAISISWSESPGIALRRLILTTMVLWIVFRCVAELGYRRALDLMAYTLIGLLIINYAYVLFTTDGIHHAGTGEDSGIAGDWHGLIPHKNDTGPVLAETIILLAFGCGRLQLVWRMLTIVAAGYFLYRTHSKTSIGLVFAGLATGAAFLRYRPAYRAFLIPTLMVAGAIAAYAAVIYIPATLAELDSSEVAFTGRIQIWRTMVGYLRDHWYMGAGFGSFWDAGNVSPANIYGRNWVSAMVSQGHNGYLDLWTQIGIFGLILAIVVLIFIPTTKLLFARQLSKPDAAAMAGILLFLVGHNFTESTMLVRDYFGNLMLAFIVAIIYNMTRNQVSAEPRGQSPRIVRRSPFAGSDTKSLSSENLS